MNPLLAYNGKPATTCAVAKVTAHTPMPVRFVWHHIRPHEAGGATTAENLVQICDNCHYTIHRIMWVMALVALQKPVTDEQRALITKPPRRAQLVLAGQGYEACRVAGTITQIPNEG